jgi:hypothetical protein
MIIERATDFRRLEFRGEQANVGLMDGVDLADCADGCSIRSNTQKENSLAFWISA